MPRPPPDTGLPRLLGEQHDDWQRGRTRRVEDYLADHPRLADAPESILELIYGEYCLRRERGEAPSTEEYRRRFPQLAERLAPLFALYGSSNVGAFDAGTHSGSADRSASAFGQTDWPPSSADDDAAHRPPSAAAPRSPELPDHIGRYQILSRLGGGGMGVVYRARHTALGKTVALKVLPKLRTGDTDAVRRFQREMIAVGQLEHPHIVTAHDAGEADGVHYLTMELVEGRDLAKLVKSRGPLPVGDACELVRQAAVGLHYVHEHGLVHRDVKPSNLMLTAGGQIKVLDLGLALVHQLGGDDDDPATPSEAVLGTVDYMAPEQAVSSHQVDRRADVYSLGCTLFHLLVGRPPFGGPEFSSAPQKLLAHVSRAPPSLSTLRADVPAPLTKVIERALAKVPDDRFATADEFATAVTTFTAGSDTRALTVDAARPAGSSDSALPATERYRPGDPPGDATSRTKRRFVRPALAAAAVVALLGIGTWFSNRPDPPKTAPAVKPSASAPSTSPQGSANSLSISLEERRAADAAEAAANDAGARWVLAQNGYVHVRRNNEHPPRTLLIENVADLPTDSYTVITVHLSGNKTIDDDALENLTPLVRITQLHLADTEVTDDGLRSLQSLSALMQLDLANTRVSDASLPLLQNMKLLATLNLQGTQTTETGIAALKTALPKCIVEK